MHTKFERLLSKSLTTLEVMTYYLVVHTGPGREADVGCQSIHPTPATLPTTSGLNWNRLVGLVVIASASRAEDPGFESCLRQDFFGVVSYQ